MEQQLVMAIADLRLRFVLTQVQGVNSHCGVMQPMFHVEEHCLVWSRRGYSFAGRRFRWSERQDLARARQKATRFIRATNFQPMMMVFLLNDGRTWKVSK